MAANIHFHPAPGLGYMMPGWFDVPQNPIVMAQRGVTYTPGVGDILPGAFAVPQNPIVDAVTGNVRPLGQGNAQGPAKGNLNAAHAHGGCGCGGGCGGACSGGGMGDIGTDLSNMMTDLSAGNFSQFFSDFGALLQEPTVMGIPVWAAGIAAYFLVSAITQHQVTVGRKR